VSCGYHVQGEHRPRSPVPDRLGQRPGPHPARSEPVEDPLPVASNIEAGGNGACTDGTHVTTPLQTASTPDTEAARQMGLVGARPIR
jgi:hypothetical protein